VSEETPPYEDEVGFTLDDLHNQEVDVAGAQAILKRALPLEGTYETNPEEYGPMTVSVAKLAEKRNGVPTGKQRTMVTLFGRGIARNLRDPETGEVGDHVAGLRFRISPEERKSPEYVDDVATGEDSERDDGPTRLWAQAVQAFRGTFGENPKSNGAVVEYLRDNTVRYRLIRTGVPTKNRPEPRGEPGTMVVAISAKRQAGG
jgi:hypothetical protein